MLKILGRVTSINVRKVLWLCGEAGLDFTREDWGKPVRDPNVAEFLALNPNGQVPVIIHDGFVLWESHAILRYLADTTGHPSWPADPQKRALVDQWLSWQSTELNPAWSYSVGAILRGNPPVPDPVRLTESLRNWDKKMDLLEAQLQAGTGFVVGDAFSLADIAMALSTHRYVAVRKDEAAALPACRAHLLAMRKRPAGFPWLGAETP